MKSTQLQKWLAMAVLLATGSLTSGVASAGIIKVKEAQGCSVEGLDGPNNVQGGVHCDANDQGFSVTDLLNGDIGLYVGDSQTPSWNLLNDTGSVLTEFTLYYSGQLANNADIDMQVGNGIFDVCFSEDANGNQAGQAGKCDAKSLKPEDGLLLPLRMTWSGGDGVGIGQQFNLGTASFAHSGQDAGCFSGTANCQPAPSVAANAPGTVGLMALGFISMLVRRRRKH